MTVDFDMDVTVNVDTAFDIDPVEGFAIASADPVRTLGLASWIEVDGARIHVDQEVRS